MDEDAVNSLCRKRTRPVRVGQLELGGGSPVVLQSMTNTHTHDVDATVQQIERLADAGCDMVRVAVPHSKDTSALPEILRQVSVPIVADVHFQYHRALEAVEAGVHKIRLNPGNIKDRKQLHEVMSACKQAGVPVRVGVNEGSLFERSGLEVEASQRKQLASDRHGYVIAQMVRTLEEYVQIFEAADFYDLVLAAKSPDPTLVIDAYRAISQRFDYPLHLGVTHAGPPATGRIRSVAALGTLLAEGIGDTIRISYAADPLYEVLDGKELLCCLKLRERREPELIACPTCGRVEVDLVELVDKVREKLASIHTPVKVAVMGCIVNGPGEAEGADVALCAGKGKAVIYVKGEKRKTVAEAGMLDALYAEVKTFVDDKTNQE